MIESCYWKEELERIARTLKRQARPPRWSQRGVCVIERDLMIGFFLLRRLIELHKVSSRIRDKRLRVFSYGSRGSPVTHLNGHRLPDVYDMDHEIVQTKKPMYISNQFVHACTSFVARDVSRNWSDILLVSDYDKNDCIWRVPIETIRTLFIQAAQDYPSEVEWKYSPDRKDYDISTD